MFLLKNCNPDYSFIMAPFYLLPDDELLKSQLLNLNYQTDRLFEVVIPDPHYSKRTWLKEYAKNLKYNVIHFPHKGNTKIPKTYDYSIFNNAVLMATTNKIITFQDWRFCHPKIIKILRMVNNFSFVGFEWQVLYKDEYGKSKYHTKSTIDISPEKANELYKTGVYGDLPWVPSRIDTFHNQSWGHYCIDKNLWLQVNGIDEVATSTRHYADLDLNARLEEYYKSRNMKIEIPMIKNVMVRIMHDKGSYMGGSYVPLDYEVNRNHLKCCFVDTSLMSDKVFMEYAVSNIYSGKFIKLYDIPYSHDFLKNNTNDALDKKHSTKGFQCRDCNVIAETPHWYEKSPKARIRSLINIGLGENKLGRDLNTLNDLIQNKSLSEKVNILNSF